MSTRHRGPSRAVGRGAQRSTIADTWTPVAEKRSRARAPALLHRDLDPIERIMRDEVDAATVRVIVDDAEALAEARAYCHRAMPYAGVASSPERGTPFTQPGNGNVMFHGRSKFDFRRR